MPKKTPAFKRSCLRYAHTAGFTSVIFAGDGEALVTCGSDGDIRRWSGIEDDDPNSTCLGEFVVCLAYHHQRDGGGELLAATDRNTVQRYSYPEIKSCGILFRFTAPATSIRVQGVFVAAGSEDGTIKVQIDGGGAETNVVDLEGHKGPILGLDICPQHRILASVGGDGLLKIWQLPKSAGDHQQDQDSSNTIKPRILDNGMMKSNSYENANCYGTMCFDRRYGEVLVYVKGKELMVLNTKSWERQSSSLMDKLLGNFTCCECSMDGGLFAAGSDQGEIVLYDLNGHRFLRYVEAPRDCKAITTLVWSPKNPWELAYCDNSGQLGTFFADSSPPSSSSGEGNAEDRDDVDEDVDEDVRKEMGLLADSNSCEDIDFVHFAADDDDDDGDGDKKKKNGGDDDDDDDNCVSLEKIKSQVMSFVNGGGGRKDSEEPQDQEENTRDSNKSSSVPSPSRCQVTTNSFKQQPPFQPGSTPRHLEHRYLTWNSVGIVTMHSSSESEGSIDVEFHDSNLHHTLHIPNYDNYNMASLSENVLAMAESGSSKLVGIALTSGSNKEWSHQLPDCESIEAIVATSRMLAVATNAHFLRIFTIQGLQREVISIPGPVVCLAGYEDRLLVCYHGAPAGLKQQYLSGLLIQTVGMKLRCQMIQVALTPGRQLIWLGFSDVGSPILLDSMGLIQLFSLKSNCWHPICDTMKLSSSVTNRFYVISVSERMQIIQAVLCRGTAYPMTTPRPMVQELPMKLPLCEADLEWSQLQDALLRACLMEMQNAERSIKENAIKMFALACRNEMEPRAKELIDIIACPELLTLAIKYSSKLGRIHLADRFTAQLAQMNEEELRMAGGGEPMVEQTIPYTSDSIQRRAAQLNAFYDGTTMTDHHHQSPNGNKLAPKVITGASLKKNILKRLTTNNNNNNNNGPSSSPTSNAGGRGRFPSTSESIPLSSEGKEVSTISQLSTGESFSSTTSFSTRSTCSNPGNLVNPFAAKRKISEVDRSGGGGIVMGSEKLKVMKK